MERRLLTLIALFTVTAVFCWRIEAGKALSSNESGHAILPLRAGTWMGIRIPVSQSVRDQLKASRIEHLDYHNEEGDTVCCYIVHGANDRASFHPPEYCFTAQLGGEITEKRRERIRYGGRLIEASSFVVPSGERKEYVLYWYRTGDSYTASYYAQQLDLLRSLVKGERKKSTFVRLSAEVTEEGKARGRERVRELLSSLSSLGVPL